ncbi:winged helix DNA-binding domain-containing protein [Amycolatopsis suaedae]|uniref:Winged helix DNA-binding domain-containing protein n=1 Tax=Amycolatopsis suaedae TaxID=2510978 RepID=A0A4Q7JE09_9PSEU|nr:winged helix DNA-binding domain-containing protein [Amycolatopsis suaedae]RZQ65677.1 winged helix DNA-binding domain-containing protein [Amycolatopsis suaedae]
MAVRVTVAQRRARLGVRHRLATRAGTPEEVAGALVALHATDPATVYLSTAARLREPSVAEVERALYDDRTLLRMLCMRRTMFVLPVAVAARAQAGAALDVERKQRTLLISHLSSQGHPDNVPGAAEWLAETEEATLRALRARGQATGAELSAEVPRLRQQLIMAKGKPYEAIGNVTSRVLYLLGLRGRIVRGRPRGSWLSSQYHWATLDTWLPGGLPELDPVTARTELARHWLTSFGPAPVSDLRWWTGWTAAQTKQALAALDLAEADLDGEPGVLLAGDTEPVPEPEPWVALLPALDPTPMGWQRRDWFLDGHQAALFDRSGNAGPTVWADGRVVGGWAQRADGEVVTRILSDVGAEVTRAVEAEAARLTAWLGEVRVTPRFRTPLEKELSGNP